MCKAPLNTMHLDCQELFLCLINGYLVSDCTATMNSFFQWKTERKFRGKIVAYVDVLKAEIKPAIVLKRCLR